MKAALNIAVVVLGMRAKNLNRKDKKPDCNRKSRKGRCNAEESVKKSDPLRLKKKNLKQRLKNRIPAKANPNKCSE